MKPLFCYYRVSSLRPTNLSSKRMDSLNTDSRDISVEEYLAGELSSDRRHEYIDGKIYAMVGASDTHALIINALAFALTPHSRKHGCQLFTSNMKVRLSIAEQDIFYYPDLLITCDSNDRATHFRRSPCLIVEVLSTNTERLDRTEKKQAYQTLTSIQEYLLVSQNRKQVEIFRRSDNWHPDIATDGDIQIQCLDCALPIDAIYQDVDI